MVTCQSSELGWEVTVELPAGFLSLGRGLSLLVVKKLCFGRNQKPVRYIFFSFLVFLILFPLLFI